MVQHYYHDTALPDRSRSARIFVTKIGAPLARVERGYIEAVVAHAGGRYSKAAGILGINRKTLYRKLAQYKAEDQQRGLVIASALIRLFQPGAP